jgi:hypothetical protein
MKIIIDVQGVERPEEQWIRKQIGKGGGVV